MVDAREAGRPWHMWAVGVLGTLWNCIGAFDYVMSQTRNAAYMAAFASEQLDYFYAFPGWAVAGWALGVWGGLIGSLLLLLRSRWAVHAFALSLIGLAISTVYQLMTPMPASMTTPGAIGLTVGIWVIAGLLLWYAMRMRWRGFLR